MSVIGIATGPNGLTRVFFDCADTPPDPTEEQWIARTIAAPLDPRLGRRHPAPVAPALDSPESSKRS